MGLLLILLSTIGSFIVSAFVTFSVICLAKTIAGRDPTRYGFDKPAEPVALVDRSGIRDDTPPSVDGEAALRNFKRG
jgi:hypothetical protein